MPTLMYGQVISKAFNKEIDFDSDTIKVALVSSAYTPNQDTHQYFSDVAANQVTGTGYVAGGATLANKTVTYNASTNETLFDANDVTWPSSVLTARYAVVYDATPGSAATQPLICYIDFTSDQASNNGDFTVQFNAAGIFKGAVA